MAASACSAAKRPISAWRWMTAVTSTRKRSGPAIDSLRKRFLKRLPSWPESAIAGARTDASTTSTFHLYCLNGTIGRYATLRTTFYSLDHLLDGGCCSDQSKLCREELLQRLTSLLSTAD